MSSPFDNNPRRVSFDKAQEFINDIEAQKELREQASEFERERRKENGWNDILEEARKWDFGIVAATQFDQQLSKSTTQAFYKNTGSKITFPKNKS